ncbi:MAG: metallophosphoesterase [Leptospirales bacterium]
MRVRSFLLLVLGSYVLLQVSMAAFLRVNHAPLVPVGVFLVFAFSMPLYFTFSYIRGWPRPLWLMPLFFGYFFLSAVAVLALILLWSGWGAFRFFHVMDVPSRTMQVGLVTALWGIFFLIAFWNRLRGPRVRERILLVENLSSSLEGIRILHVSDVHVGLFESDRSLLRLRKSIESSPFDILLFTGDMIDRHLTEIDRFLHFFGDLKGRLGVYCVLGNHEYWIDGPRIAARLEEAGWPVLENRSFRIPVGEHHLTLVGISDPSSKENEGGGPDPQKAFQEVSRDHGETVIVLAHHPILWDLLESYPATLTLSGHTHGGQIGFLRTGWTLASPFYDYDLGMFSREASGGKQWLLVNSGTGYFGVPVRIGIPSSLEVIVLSSGLSAKV